jgi:hypothetical protein
MQKKWLFGGLEPLGARVPPSVPANPIREFLMECANPFSPRQEPDRISAESYLKMVLHLLTVQGSGTLARGGADGWIGGFQRFTVFAGGDQL